MRPLTIRTAKKDTSVAGVLVLGCTKFRGEGVVRRWRERCCFPYDWSSMPKSLFVWPRSSAIVNYGFAVLCFAATFAVVSVLDYMLMAAPPVSLFLCAIIIVAWYADLGPALLTTALPFYPSAISTCFRLVRFCWPPGICRGSFCLE